MTINEVNWLYIGFAAGITFSLLVVWLVEKLDARQKRRELNKPSKSEEETK